MKDETEHLRKAMIESNQPALDLTQADKKWTTQELQEEFEVLGFLAPFCAVRRKADGVKGSMEFTHNPRFYFNFIPDTMIGRYDR